MSPIALRLLFVAPTVSALVVAGLQSTPKLKRMRPPGMSHCNIYPIFSIKDLALAKPYMQECVEATDAEPGCLYYGWTISEDQSTLFCRETYVDGKAAASHLAAAGPIVGKMLDAGGVVLESIGVMGTDADLADVQEQGDKLGCAYWRVYDSFSNFRKESSVVPSSQAFLTLQPTFSINDMATAEPFMKQCVEATRAEAGCVYYGWTISSDGKLFCREAYVNGAAVNTHLINAVPIVGAMLESGAVSLDKIELHGPRSEWAACKEEADKLGMVYFDVDASFAKFAL
jgi:quinol monooxygenase YgiN